MNTQIWNIHIQDTAILYRIQTPHLGITFNQLPCWVCTVFILPCVPCVSFAFGFLSATHAPHLFLFLATQSVIPRSIRTLISGAGAPIHSCTIGLPWRWHLAGPSDAEHQSIDSSSCLFHVVPCLAPAAGRPSDQCQAQRCLRTGPPVQQALQTGTVLYESTVQYSAVHESTVQHSTLTSL